MSQGRRRSGRSGAITVAELTSRVDAASPQAASEDVTVAALARREAALAAGWSRAGVTHTAVAQTFVPKRRVLCVAAVGATAFCGSIASVAPLGDAVLSGDSPLAEIMAAAPGAKDEVPPSRVVRASTPDGGTGAPPTRLGPSVGPETFELAAAYRAAPASILGAPSRTGQGAASSRGAGDHRPQGGGEPTLGGGPSGWDSTEQRSEGGEQAIADTGRQVPEDPAPPPSHGGERPTPQDGVEPPPRGDAEPPRDDEPRPDDAPGGRSDQGGQPPRGDSGRPGEHGAGGDQGDHRPNHAGDAADANRPDHAAHDVGDHRSDRAADPEHSGASQGGRHRAENAEPGGRHRAEDRGAGDENRGADRP